MADKIDFATLDSAAASAIVTATGGWELLAETVNAGNTSDVGISWDGSYYDFKFIASATSQGTDDHYINLVDSSGTYVQMTMGQRLGFSNSSVQARSEVWSKNIVVFESPTVGANMEFQCFSSMATDITGRGYQSFASMQGSGSNVGFIYFSKNGGTLDIRGMRFLSNSSISNVHLAAWGRRKF